MTRKQYGLFILVGSLLLGIFTDLLIRQQIFGLNFVIWSLVWASLIVVSAYKKKLLSLQLGVYVCFLLLNTIYVYIRSEPIVQVWLVLSTLVFMVLAVGYVHIPGFSSLSLISRVFASIVNAVLAPFGTLQLLGRNKEIDKVKKTLPNVPAGVLVAIPLVLLFIGLFSSSDEVFKGSFSWLGDAFESFGQLIGDLNTGRLITNTFWSITSLVVLSAILLISEQRIQVNPRLPSSKSSKDSLIVLLSVIFVYSLFVFIQLRYLFNGSTLPDGITYASYARRGYGELLLATLITSAVIYIFCAIVDSAKSSRVRVASFILAFLNMIVVASAWKRLSLYESAYGWTMTRFVARMGLVCILIGSIILILWISKRLSSKSLYSAGWYTVAGVLLVSAIINPVGQVTKRNILDLPNREVPLDVGHMLNQSPDSYRSICLYAPRLKAANQSEYSDLRRRSTAISSQFSADDYVNTYKIDRPYMARETSLLSGHYVYTAGFIEKYHNCLK